MVLLLLFAEDYYCNHDYYTFDTSKYVLYLVLLLFAKSLPMHIPPRAKVLGLQSGAIVRTLSCKTSIPNLQEVTRDLRNIVYRDYVGRS